MLRFKQYLQEAQWNEQYYHAIEMCKKYPNDWIHFTDIPKIGIYPVSHHKDPPGVYFYQCKWIANSQKHSEFQYGTTKKYFYIWKIKISDGINLGTMSERDAYNESEKNGWSHHFMEGLRYPEKYLVGNQMLKKNWKKPGGVFYGVADGLANTNIFGERIPWTKTLKGVSLIYDPGRGIIYQNEPKQLGLLDIRKGKQLYFGENKPDYNRSNKEVVDHVISEFGGTVKWHNKKNLIHNFEFEGAPIEIEYDLRSVTYYITAFVNGRKITKRYIAKGTYDEWNKQTASGIRYNIREFIKQYSPQKTGKELRWADHRTIDKAITEIGMKTNLSWIDRPDHAEGFLTIGNFDEIFIRVVVNDEDVVSFQYNDDTRKVPFEFSGSFSTKADIQRLKREYETLWRQHMEIIRKTENDRY